MTIREALNQGVIMLKNENIESPKIKARVILEFTLKKTREFLIVYDKKEITQKQRDEYVRNIKRLIQGEPLQYITGLQEFMKLKFFVNKHVLIPRQDTEILVEEVIEIAKKLETPTILDLCTGSGAIAVSVAKYIENSKITATDISKEALEVAKKNARFNGIFNNIEFIESDMFKKLKNRKFDIIVSNPPYIPTKEIKKLPIDVQNEPAIALDGGSTGLDFYEIIANQGSNYLNRNGFICLEIGFDQRARVQDILRKNKHGGEIYCKKDLCGNDRVIVVHANNYN